MTEEELRDLVTGAQALSLDERRIVGEVFDAGKRQIREVLVPRTEVVFLDAETPVSAAAAIAAGRAVLAAAGVHRQLRQRDRLRARPGPARARGHQPLGAGRPDRPAGEVPADQQDRAVLAVRDAARAGAPGHRGRRLRRHGRHRHPGGPGRGADRRHQGRVRHRAGPGDHAARAARSRWTACSTWTSSPSRPASPCPRAPTRRPRATCWPCSATCRRPGHSVQVAGHTITVTELDGRRIARLRVAPTPPPDRPGAVPPNAPERAAGTRSRTAANARECSRTAPNAAVPAAPAARLDSEKSQVEGG